VLSLAVSTSCSPEAPEAVPNVLLIVLDTTRADALSTYGAEQVTTPAIDRVASKGIRFEQAIATDYWTLPTHASLLAGRYPSDHQATSETNHLPGQATTLAERLSEAGYDTAAFVSNS
jgi:arylsulfatase A-like enzyme